MSRPTGRAFGINNVQNDVFMGNSALSSPPLRRRRLEMPANIFLDEENQPNPPDTGEILKELRELKELMHDMKGRQNSMEKAISKITKLMERKDFDLAKSTHAANVTKIFAKAYVQLGRFAKTNESKTEQLRNEFINSPHGLSVQELLVHATSFEKAKFIYWRAEERRRILAIGTWSSLQDASNNEVAAKICNLLGLKYNAALEIAVRQQTALVREYITCVGTRECQADEKFWLNFYKWSEEKYGPRGPTNADWEVIMSTEE